MSPTSSLSTLVDRAAASHREHPHVLFDAQMSLQHLNAQIAAFLRDENTHPPRHPGIFLCQLAFQLRALASGIDATNQEATR